MLKNSCGLDVRKYSRISMVKEKKIPCSNYNNIWIINQIPFQDVELCRVF